MTRSGGQAGQRGGSLAADGPDLLAGLLPQAAVVELFADPPDVRLYPEEAEFVARAVDKRRREFATVRLCARAALAQIGTPPQAILPGHRGAPLWPEAVVGSMTHCDTYRAAAVARSATVAALGIDAEPDLPLPTGVRETVALPQERRQLDQLSATHPYVAWDRLLFSAKESTYKAWFPLVGRFLDFDECEITLDPELGTFTSSLKVPGPVVGARRLSRFSGRWRTVSHQGSTYVATAVVVPPPSH